MAFYLLYSFGFFFSLHRHVKSKQYKLRLNFYKFETLFSLCAWTDYGAATAFGERGLFPFFKGLDRKNTFIQKLFCVSAHMCHFY